MPGQWRGPPQAAAFQKRHLRHINKPNCTLRRPNFRLIDGAEANSVNEKLPGLDSDCRKCGES